MAVTPLIRIQNAPFDLNAEMTRLVAGNHDIGAVTSFTGLCRDEGGRLKALELEHYPGMAEAELARVAQQACSRWPLNGLTAIHRHAFAAAEFMMDYLKTRAPFWKREHLADGTTGGWVEAKDADDAAASRWARKESCHDKIRSD